MSTPAREYTPGHGTGGSPGYSGTSRCYYGVPGYTPYSRIYPVLPATRTPPTYRWAWCPRADARNPLHSKGRYNTDRKGSGPNDHGTGTGE